LREPSIQRRAIVGGGLRLGDPGAALLPVDRNGIKENASHRRHVILKTVDAKAKARRFTLAGLALPAL